MNYPKLNLSGPVKEISLFTGFALEITRNEGYGGRTLRLDFHRKIHSGLGTVFTLVDNNAYTFHFNNRIIMVGYRGDEETIKTIGIVKEVLFNHNDVAHVVIRTHTEYVSGFNGEAQGYSKEEIFVPKEMVIGQLMDISDTVYAPSHEFNRPGAELNEFQTMADLLDTPQSTPKTEASVYNNIVQKLEFFDYVDLLFYREKKVPYRYHITGVLPKASGGYIIKLNHMKEEPGDDPHDFYNVTISTKDGNNSVNFYVSDHPDIEDALQDPQNALRFICPVAGMVDFRISQVTVDVYAP